MSIKKKWLIYKHTSPSGKSYIGQTSLTIDDRWDGHVRGALKENADYAISRAIRKHGKDNFAHEILEDNIETQEAANEREQYWIAFHDTFNNGYNMTSGGQHCDGTRYNDELKQKMSEAQQRPDVRAKKRNAQIKNWQDPDYREKTTATMKSNWEDPEYREKQLAIRNTPESKMKRSMSQQAAQARVSVKENNRQANIKRWEDPEYREKQIAIKNTPEYKNKQREAQLKAQNDPKVKENKKQKNLELWADPEYRQKRLDNKLRRQQEKEEKDNSK